MKMSYSEIISHGAFAVPLSFFSVVMGVLYVSFMDNKE